MTEVAEPLSSIGVAERIVERFLAVAGAPADVVLAPGSRSAPLAFVLAEREREGRVRLHVRVDERSAGFLALGIAKLSGRPVAVVCTSGTAVANLMPAAVEAWYSDVPLVLVTADRPPRSRATGSPQTIDQVGFFAGVTARSIDVLTGREDLDAVLAQTTGPRRRPVHINAGFEMPLVPLAGVAEGQAARAAVPSTTEGVPQPDAMAGASIPVGRSTEGFGEPDVMTGASERNALALPPRSVILLGDTPAYRSDEVGAAVGALSEAHGWPILCEPSGNGQGLVNAVSHGPALLSGAGALTVDGVLTVGSVGLTRSVLAMVRAAAGRGGHHAVHLAGPDAPDPLRTASVVLSRVPDPIPGHQADATWMALWREREARAASVVAEVCESCGLCGPSVARETVSLLPDGSVLLVAASWSVRHVEAFATRRGGLQIVGNRGANGIDGLVSTAWGVALAHEGPTVALMGDLAFIHDHNGLVSPTREERPNLTIVVNDNNGGGIFHQLEQGRPEFAEDFERLFGTPTDLDLLAVARAAGARAVLVESGRDFSAALRGAVARPGIDVVIARGASRQAEAELLIEISRRLA